MVAQMVKNPPAMQETCVQPLSQEDPLGMGGGLVGCHLWGHTELDITEVI